LCSLLVGQIYTFVDSKLLSPANSWPTEPHTCNENTGETTATAKRESEHDVLLVEDRGQYQQLCKTLSKTFNATQPTNHKVSNCERQKQSASEIATFE